MAREEIQMIRHRLIGLATVLFMFSGCIGWSGWCSPLQRLSAQEAATPPETFSILESSTDFDESLPPPALPQASSAASTPEPPNGSGLADEPDPMPESPTNPGDPFANLFLDLSQPDSRSQPTPPNELELNSRADSDPESLPAPIANVAHFPVLPTSDGYTVLLAGPIHEAFIVSTDSLRAAREQTVVATAPPKPVREQAPQSGSGPNELSVPQFVGNKVQWISGYWAWLTDAEKYVWVSGLYRDIPPGRKWVAGAWEQTDGGYHWTNGYWAEAQGNKSAVSPLRQAPPPLRANVPGTPAPDPDSFWIPGQWVVALSGSDAADTQRVALPRESNYRWQPGYWSKREKQWIWQPAHYVHTPTGYLYVSGYWDYEPHFRGQAFAPVIFDLPSLAEAEIVYSPSYPLSRPAAALLHMFSKSDSHHYFYGDFYDRAYVELGYRTWYEDSETESSEGTPLVPLLDFYQWKYGRLGVDFRRSMSRFAHHFRSAPSIRPAAQLETKPELAQRDGLAGQVNAETFDDIVRGYVGGQTVVLLAGMDQRTAAKLMSDSNDTTSSGAPSDTDNSSAVVTASATTSQGATPANAPGADGPTTAQRGAAPSPGAGTARLMVLPGGRIMLAPAAGGPFGPLSPPPGVRLPPPPAPPFGFGSRLRRR